MKKNSPEHGAQLAVERTEIPWPNRNFSTSLQAGLGALSADQGLNCPDSGVRCCSQNRFTCLLDLPLECSLPDNTRNQHTEMIH